MSVSIKHLSLLLLIFLFSFSSYAQVSLTNFGAKFEYDLKLNVDANKRAAYLKRNNEQPSAYEKVFTVLTGTVQVATVVDDVKFTQNSYQITSIGNLIAGLSTALGGQRLVRESIGTIIPSGLLSSVYQEKRGNTDFFN